MATAPARILLVDDHALVRAALARTLEPVPEFSVVGQAADGWEAIEQVEQHSPNVVLMDVNMPRLNGIEATKLIVSALPEVKVIGLSMHDADVMAHRMLEAGAVAYVPKSAPLHELIDAIRNAHPVPSGSAGE